jgi:ribosomal protein S18 acetylase RimI-like enzyme
MSKAVTIRLCDVSDARRLMDSDAFDHAADAELIADFFSRQGHHLIGAFDGDQLIGFVSGIEVAHPDKPVEMMLYELGVEASHRRRGIGRSLVDSLAVLATDVGCAGMWVPLEASDEIARATYRSAGAAGFEHAAVMTWDLRGVSGDTD